MTPFAKSLNITDASFYDITPLTRRCFNLFLTDQFDSMKPPPHDNLWLEFDMVAARGRGATHLVGQDLFLHIEGLESEKVALFETVPEAGGYLVSPEPMVCSARLAIGRSR